jgi:hypothetical protein
VVLSKEKGSQFGWNAFCLTIHYSILVSLLLCTEVSVLNILTLMLVRGFMTAIVVFANHYPEDRLPAQHSMGLFEQTLRTSRNTTGLLFNHSGDTFVRRVFNQCTGFLSMQIEHHMAPTWPSGNLMKLRPRIQQLAAKHHLPYNETSIATAVWENIAKLGGGSSMLDEVKKLQ